MNTETRVLAPSAQRFLFVVGCPRSGTTAMWRLLTGDPRIVLGNERYGNRWFEEELTPDLYRKERFARIEEGDTFYGDLAAFHERYEAMLDRYDGAVFVGDKIPMLFTRLDTIADNFPGAKVILLLRNIFDVAASYERRARDSEDTTWSQDLRTSSAIDQWNESIEVAMEHPGSLDIQVVDYERFFFQADQLDRLYDGLGLDVPPNMPDEHGRIITRARQLEEGRPRDLPQAAVHEICLRADFEGYRQLVG
jgi:hypothetical protein